MREFLDFDFHGDIDFMSSLAAFDGAVRWVNGRRALLFGIDTIAAIHGNSAKLEPLLDHELFHLYHRQFFHIDMREEREPLWAALWAEGLATYVSKRMNPQATDRQIFGLPENMPARTRETLPRIAAELLHVLDSTAGDDYTGSSSAATRAPTRRSAAAITLDTGSRSGSARAAGFRIWRRCSRRRCGGRSKRRSGAWSRTLGIDFAPSRCYGVPLIIA